MAVAHVTERPRDALGRPLPAGSVDEQPVISRPTSDADAWTRGTQFITGGQPFAAHELFELRWRDVDGPDRQAWQALAKWGAALTHAARGNPTGAASVARGALDLLDTAPSIPDCLDITLVRNSLHALVSP